MKKVRTKKELESQGYAKIESNDLWGFGEEGEFKYVLNEFGPLFLFLL